MKAKALLLIIALFIMTMAVSGQNSFTQGAIKGYKIKMNVGQAAGSVYHWSVNPSSGTSIDLTQFTGDTVTIAWDGFVGNYTLSVQVSDGNGCLSETISQTVEILSPGDLAFDTDYPSTIVCSDLVGGNEGSVPAHSQSSFRIVYTGDVNLLSANLTIKNPNSDFIDLDGTVLSNQGTPVITITNIDADKEIIFAVIDSWENNSDVNDMYEIVLISAKTADNAEIIANPDVEAKRTISVLPKPVIDFE